MPGIPAGLLKGTEMNPLKICAMKRTPQQQFEAEQEALRLAEHWGFENKQTSVFLGLIMANVNHLKAARIVRERCCD